MLLLKEFGVLETDRLEIQAEKYNIYYGNVIWSSSSSLKEAVLRSWVEIILRELDILSEFLRQYVSQKKK